MGTDSILNLPVSGDHISDTYPRLVVANAALILAAPDNHSAISEQGGECAGGGRYLLHESPGGDSLAPSIGRIAPADDGVVTHQSGEGIAVADREKERDRAMSVGSAKGARLAEHSTMTR